MKKIFVLIVFSFLFTGCYDYRELDSLSIVSMMFIDYNLEKDEYELGFQVHNMKKGDEETTFVVYRESGNTISEIIRNMSKSAPKKIYLGSLDLIVISENFSIIGIDKMVDFLLRNLEINKNANIVLVRGDDASSILEVKSLQDEIPSETIISMLDLSTIYSGISINDSYDVFLSNIISFGIDAVIPVIEIIEDQIEVTSLAHFKDSKLGGFLTLEEGFVYDLVMGKTNKAVFSFKCDTSNYASIEIVNIKSGYKIDSSKSRSNINIKMYAYLSEFNCNSPIQTKKDIEALERLIKRELERTILRSLNSIETDIFGYERYIYRNDYRYYMKNRWNMETLVSNINPKVSINLNIIRKGGNFDDTKK